MIPLSGEKFFTEWCNQDKFSVILSHLVSPKLYSIENMSEERAFCYILGMLHFEYVT